MVQDDHGWGSRTDNNIQINVISIILENIVNKFIGLYEDRLALESTYSFRA